MIKRPLSHPWRQSKFPSVFKPSSYRSFQVQIHPCHLRLAHHHARIAYSAAPSTTTAQRVAAPRTNTSCARPGYSPCDNRLLPNFVCMDCLHQHQMQRRVLAIFASLTGETSDTSRCFILSLQPPQAVRSNMWIQNNHSRQIQGQIRPRKAGPRPTRMPLSFLCLSVFLCLSLSLALCRPLILPVARTQSLPFQHMSARSWII